MLFELALGFALGALLVVYARRGELAREAPVFALGVIAARRCLRLKARDEVARRARRDSNPRPSAPEAGAVGAR